MIIIKNKEIGQRLRAIRKHFKLTQDDFASRVKIHQSTLALFEKGERVVKDIYIKIICDEFDVSGEWLKNGSGSMFRPKKEISLDDYAKIHSLTDLEKEILVTYMSIDKETRIKFVQSFGRVLRFIQLNNDDENESIIYHDNKYRENSTQGKNNN